MAVYGFGAVSAKAILAFLSELAAGAWGAVALDGYVGPQPPALSLRTPHDVGWKLRFTWAIDDLRAAMFATDDLNALDTEWDRLQNRLAALVTADENADDPARRDAAGRVRAALLAGQGTVQTTFSLDDEVDFGRVQVQHVDNDKDLTDDVQLLGYGDLLGTIGTATEALAQGLGRGSGGGRPAPRSTQVRDRFNACVAALNAVYDEIGWFLAHAPAGAVQGQLQQLLAPLDDLLARGATAATTATAASTDTSAPGTAAAGGTTAAAPTTGGASPAALAAAPAAAPAGATKRAKAPATRKAKVAKARRQAMGAPPPRARAKAAPPKRAKAAPAVDPAKAAQLAADAKAKRRKARAKAARKAG